MIPTQEQLDESTIVLASYAKETGCDVNVKLRDRKGRIMAIITATYVDEEDRVDE